MKMKTLSTLLFACAIAWPCEAALAVDGCKVLLCLSNPKGPKAVAECVTPIDELMKDLAKGKAFPKCSMSNANGGDAGTAESTSASYQPASAKFCPAEHMHTGRGNGDVSECKFMGAISVTIDSKPYSRIWYAEDGTTFTEYGPK
jgi:hypothetical protein